MDKLPLFSKKPARGRIQPALGSFQYFLREEGLGGVLLLLATALALLWANSALSPHYETLWQTRFSFGAGEFTLSKPLILWINDGLMAVFFFVVGLEIKREIQVGELSRPRQALFPIVAALGGMLVPALIYLAFNQGGAAAQGWGIPMATDIAFALGVMSLMGKRAPVSLKIFLTAVAIVDDIGAVLVIALFYSGTLNTSALLAAGAIFLLLLLLNRLAVRSPLPYAFLGIFLWLAVLQSGVHATVAGVLLAATIPSRQTINSRSFLRNSRNYLDSFEKAAEPGREVLPNKGQRAALHALENAAESVSSPLQRLEHALHPWVALAIMPVFALANAGVVLSGGGLSQLGSPSGLGIIFGLVLGKQTGITGFTWLAVRLGWVSRPTGLSWRHIYGASWLAGIGFTMSLFITALAFSSAEMVTTAKFAILAASLLSAAGGWIVLSLGKGKAK
jgi:NhaA family Na+:H+ antiporter